MLTSYKSDVSPTTRLDVKMLPCNKLVLSPRARNATGLVPSPFPDRGHNSSVCRFVYASRRFSTKVTGHTGADKGVDIASRSVGEIGKSLTVPEEKAVKEALQIRKTVARDKYREQRIRDGQSLSEESVDFPKQTKRSVQVAQAIYSRNRTPRKISVTGSTADLPADEQAHNEKFTVVRKHSVMPTRHPGEILSIRKYRVMEPARSGRDQHEALKEKHHDSEKPKRLSWRERLRESALRKHIRRRGYKHSITCDTDLEFSRRMVLKIKPEAVLRQRPVVRKRAVLTSFYYSRHSLRKLPKHMLRLLESRQWRAQQKLPFKQRKKTSRTLLEKVRFRTWLTNYARRARLLRSVYRGPDLEQRLQKAKEDAARSPEFTFWSQKMGRLAAPVLVGSKGGNGKHARSKLTSRSPNQKGHINTTRTTSRAALSNEAAVMKDMEQLFDDLQATGTLHPDRPQQRKSGISKSNPSCLLEQLKRGYSAEPESPATGARAMPSTDDEATNPTDDVPKHIASSKQGNPKSASK